MIVVLTILGIVAWWAVGFFSITRAWRYSFDLTLGEAILHALFFAWLGPLGILIMLGERPKSRSPRVVAKRIVK